MSRHTILITGASKGIGLSVAEKLAGEGHNVVGLARNAEGLSFPGTLVSCDLSREEETDVILRRLAGQFDIDGIVNNVGYAVSQPLGAIDLTVLDSTLKLNVRAAVQITQFFVEAMKQRGWGRIVNVCSRAIYGSPKRTAYSASKSALVGCTRTWALELAEYGITSNAVAPGPVDTELFRKQHPVGSEAEMRVVSSNPMRRVGTPADVAAPICFLLSDEAAYVTGQVLAVDGGVSLGGW